MLFQLLLGLLLGSLIAYLAYRARALTLRGAVTAALLGMVIFGLGGLPWAVLLLAFFISSSLLSRLFRRRKAALDEKFSKGSQRDAVQVLANGGIAGLLVMVQWICQAAGLAIGPLVWLGYAASLAAANADTWATELGILSRRPPLLITTGKPVDRGASGGVSLAGLLAALGGAALVAILACGMALLGWTPGGVETAWLALLLVSGAGLAGSLVDSVLGATVQAIYECPACRKETERHPTHSCGTATVLKRGWRWLNNDWVNAACTLSGVILAIGIGAAIQPAPAASSYLPGGNAMTIQLSTTAFSQGGLVPKAYTCDGADRSPDLSWSGLPTGTASLALIMEDPDAPGGTFTHWIVYNLPATAAGLAENQLLGPNLLGGGSQGTNSFGRVGYAGPCPPPGKPHRYFFRLYALDIAAQLAPGLKVDQLRKALAGHILGQGEWMGRYSR